MIPSNVTDVFAVTLNRIKDMIKAGNYDGCANRTSDLATIAICFDYKTGILISSVLADAFEQMEETIQTRMVDDKAHSDIGNQLLIQMDAVLKSCKEDDNDGLFEALREISSTTTKFFYYGFESPKRPGMKDLFNADE